MKIWYGQKVVNSLCERYVLDDSHLKISIIIPVYNCENYLEQCIQSVLDQTLKELEVICVDDGSSDQSAKVIQRIALKDIRVRFFQQKNQGQGIARNLGLKNARGKYVAFLDADDYYANKDALEKMYLACEENHAAVSVSLNWQEGDKIKVLEPAFSGIKNHEILNYQDLQVDYNFTNYLFRRYLVVDHQIFFPPYRRFEDPPFLVKVLHKAGSFVSVNTCLYCYRVPDLLSRFNDKNVVDLISGLVDNLNYAKIHGLEILFYNTKIRLEYEYFDVILSNISPDNVAMTERLIEANRIINVYEGNSSYVIRPLRRLLLYASQYEKKLLAKIRKENSLFVYGAGRFGRAFLKFLKANGLADRIKYVVVSEKKENPSELEGISVMALKDLYQEKETWFLIAAGEKIQQEIQEYLRKYQYKNYETIQDEFLNFIAEQEQNCTWETERLSKGE